MLKCLIKDKTPEVNAACRRHTLQEAGDDGMKDMSAILNRQRLQRGKFQADDSSRIWAPMTEGATFETFHGIGIFVICV